MQYPIPKNPQPIEQQPYIIPAKRPKRLDVITIAYFGKAFEIGSDVLLMDGRYVVIGKAPNELTLRRMTLWRRICRALGVRW